MGDCLRTPGTVGMGLDILAAIRRFWPLLVLVKAKCRDLSVIMVVPGLKTFSTVCFNLPSLPELDLRDQCNFFHVSTENWSDS